VYLLWLTLVACGSKAPPEPALPKPPPAEAAPAPAAASEAIAPRPYTADQIRDAMPVGTDLRHRIAEAGKPAVVSHGTVVAADATTCTFASKTEAEDGSLIEDEGQHVFQWTELMEHATFPAAHTVQSEGSVDVPAGHFDTIRYVVTEDDGSISTYDFPKGVPGPPVSYTVVAGGQTVFSMTLLSRK
jgi:hypothetical protein